MNTLKTSQAIKQIYSSKILEEWDTYERPLYYFIEKALDNYLEVVKKIKRDDFSISSDELFFNGSYTKGRFQNLISRIADSIKQILLSCYKGDIVFANKLLYNLLLGRCSKTKQYLVEPYVNHFDFEVLKDKIFYRMRDDNIGNEVKDCSYVPFDLRYKIDSNRFSLQGLPCLYLADSKDTASKEIRPLEEGKCRWVSEFVPKETITLIDLRFRNVLSMGFIDAYNSFKLLITYPLRLLCSLKVKQEEGNFHEEYYFPQLLSHLILIYLKEHSNDNLYIGAEGILFDSTQNDGGYNIIIPALYDKKKPPISGHCSKIEKLFKESNLKVYEENATSTT